MTKLIIKLGRRRLIFGWGSPPPSDFGQLGFLFFVAWLEIGDWMDKKQNKITNVCPPPARPKNDGRMTPRWFQNYFKMMPESCENVTRMIQRSLKKRSSITFLQLSMAHCINKPAGKANPKVIGNKQNTSAVMACIPESGYRCALSGC